MEAYHDRGLEGGYPANKGCFSETRAFWKQVAAADKPRPYCWLDEPEASEN